MSIDALLDAVSDNNIDALRTLLSTSSPSQDDLNLALKSACEENSAPLATLLLDNGAQITPAVIDEATAHEDPIALFETLKAHGWDINNGNIYDPTKPLAMARIAQNETTDALAWLLSQGGDPNLWDTRPNYEVVEVEEIYQEDGTVQSRQKTAEEIQKEIDIGKVSPLESATAVGAIENIELLLEHGAEIEAGAVYKTMAIKSSYGLECLKIFVEKKKEVVHMVDKEERFRSLLIANVARKPRITPDEKVLVKITKFLIESGIDVNALCSLGRSALRYVDERWGKSSELYKVIADAGGRVIE